MQLLQHIQLTRRVRVVSFSGIDKSELELKYTEILINLGNFVLYEPAKKLRVQFN